MSDDKDVTALERLIHDAADVFEECLDFLDEDRPLIDAETLFKRPLLRARIAEWCTSVEKYITPMDVLARRGQ
jgi:hypothetical protein